MCGWNFFYLQMKSLFKYFKAGNIFSFNRKKSLKNFEIVREEKWNKVLTKKGIFFYWPVLFNNVQKQYTNALHFCTQFFLKRKTFETNPKNYIYIFFSHCPDKSQRKAGEWNIFLDLRFAFIFINYYVYALKERLLD